MRPIDLLIITLAALFFFAVFNHIAERADRKAMTEIERLEFDEARLLINEIRQSGLIGLNLNHNPEI